MALCLFPCLDLSAIELSVNSRRGMACHTSPCMLEVGPNKGSPTTTNDSTALSVGFTFHLGVGFTFHLVFTSSLIPAHDGKIKVLSHVCPHVKWIGMI